MASYNTFKMLVGKTIKQVKQHSINVVHISCEDGSEFEIDCDEQHMGVAVLRCVQFPAKNK